MSVSRQTTRLLDFSSAEYTAILSDLHLCEEEPLNRRFPLWKKYKTRKFFFDEAFATFLQQIERESKGAHIELILNGDIFDFDSVTTKPESPPYRVTWLERKRGLHPQEEKSQFKIKKILEDHIVWVSAIRSFIARGHRVVIIIGNHDLEMHFPLVKRTLLDALAVGPDQERIRFADWFYISNKDTLIEHGNQYDPYCVAEDPLNPFVLKFNRIETRLPFGNLTTRYLINGMGFFNPHVGSNFIMSASEYVRFFLRYIVGAQPFIMFSWLWGATVVLIQSFLDRLLPSIKDPLTFEDKVEYVARKANATPRMVRELRELFVPPAASSPITLMRELWLDRAFLVLIAFLSFFFLVFMVRQLFQISFFWIFVPLFLFLPFFIFYSRNVSSEVMQNAEPKDDILNLSSQITKVNRIVYGHTHIARHEIIGAVEHLNSGTWSPAFEDVECTKPIGHKTFVWIFPGRSSLREAKLMEFVEDRIKESSASGRANRRDIASRR